MIIQIDEKTRIKVESCQFVVQYKAKKVNKLTKTAWGGEWFCGRIESAIQHIIQDRIAKNKDTVPLMEFPKIWKSMNDEITNIINKSKNES